MAIIFHFDALAVVTIKFNCYVYVPRTSVKTAIPINNARSSEIQLLTCFQEVLSPHFVV